MRRFGVLLALAVVGSTFVGLSGTAVADANRPTSFCSSAKKVGEDFADISDGDLTDSDFLETVETAFKKLAKQAPSQLKSAFKTVTAFYKKLADGDIDATDPQDVAAFTKEATKSGKALTKIQKYLVNKCKLDLS